MGDGVVKRRWSKAGAVGGRVAANADHAREGNRYGQGMP